MRKRTIEHTLLDGAQNIYHSALLPMLNSLHPKAAESVEELKNQGAYIAGTIREEIEDIVAEAQFERMKKHVDEEMKQ